MKSSPDPASPGRPAEAPATAAPPVARHGATSRGPASAPASASASAPRPAARVLVVEDSALLRTTLSRQLTGAGFEVATAADGVEALEAIHAQRPDIVISDVMMPRMDGFELCRRVRADRDLAGLFFVMLTAKEGQEAKITGLESGADDYLRKPHSMPEMLARLRGLLRVKALQDELRESNRQLRELAAMKDEFMGIAAHDMRSPLTVMKAYLELVLEQAQGDLRFMAQACAEQVDAMLSLINDLLDLTRIDSGRVTLQTRPVDLAPFLARHCELYTMMATRKGIVFTTDLARNLGRAAVDPDRFGEVVVNLLSNAVKYARKGDSIAVRLARAGAELLFSVADTGPGISPQEVKLLFQKFAKISTRPTGNEGKTGLGLAIVKKIVELHGGRVWAESDLGNGSTFSVALPVVEDA